MKVFSFTFIFYIMLLLTQPCQDLFAGVNDCDGKDRQSVHLDNSSETDSGPDECSPFCICSCCSLSVADRSFAFAITPDIETVSIVTNPVEYTNPYTPNYQDSIWQPPKV